MATKKPTPRSQEALAKISATSLSKRGRSGKAKPQPRETLRTSIKALRNELENSVPGVETRTSLVARLNAALELPDQ